MTPRDFKLVRIGQRIGLNVSFWPASACTPLKVQLNRDATIVHLPPNVNKSTSKMDRMKMNRLLNCIPQNLHASKGPKKRDP